MRTALILLSCSRSPRSPARCCRSAGSTRRRSTSTSATTPSWRPWLDRLGAFEVFGSPWFSAIYLLLFISLVGCLAAPAARPPPGAAVPAAGRAEAAGPAAAARRAGGRRPVPTRRPSPRCCAAPVAGARSGGDDGLRREGLPQGDRQPAVPLLADRGADRGRARLVVRLARQPAAGRRRGQRLLQHPPAVRRGHARPPGRTAPTCRRSACGWTTSRPGSSTPASRSRFTRHGDRRRPGRPDRQPPDFSVN